MTLLEKYIAKVESLKEKRDFTGEKWPRETQAETDGWNSALSEVQSLLPELIKEVRKDGYFEALDDTREWITRSGGIPEGYITDVLDNLRKNLI